MSFKYCRGDGDVVSLEKILWFECVCVFACVIMSRSVSAGQVFAGLDIQIRKCASSLSALNYLYASHMVFIDPCPCYTPPAPSCSVSLSLCADGEGMMECWRVNLWFPGSWSGFIRSGCDNTPADGPTKRLYYERRSANKKPSWKK